MQIDDTDFKEILELLPQENLPSDPAEARRAVENFVDLVELLMRPLPLPPAGPSALRQPSSDLPEQAPVSLPRPQSTSEFEGRD